MKKKWRRKYVVWNDMIWRRKYESMWEVWKEENILNEEMKEERQYNIWRMKMKWDQCLYYSNALEICQLIM